MKQLLIKSYEPLDVIEDKFNQFGNTNNHSNYNPFYRGV